jgi:hypothetical protein
MDFRGRACSLSKSDFASFFGVQKGKATTVAGREGP